MKHSHHWLAAGAMTLALMGCMQNGVSPSNASQMQTQMDQAFSAMQGPMILDSGSGPELGFANELGLTAEQKARIRDTVEEVHERLKPPPPKGRTRPSFTDMKARQGEMRDSVWAAVMNILDSSQQAKALAMRDQIEKGGRPCPGAVDHVRMLADKLGLDSNQVAQVTAILAQEPALAHKAFDEATSFEEFQSKLDALHQSLGSQILAVLDERQAAIFKTLRPEPPRPSRRP